jgi:hypothetical protein
MAYNTPLIVEIIHREITNINTQPNVTLGNEYPTEGINAEIYVRLEQWAYLAIHGNTPLCTSRVYNRLHSEEHNPTFLSTTKQHIADRGDSIRKTVNRLTSQATHWSS